MKKIHQKSTFVHIGNKTKCIINYKVIDSKSRKFNPDKEDRSYKCVELEHLSSETGQLLGYVNSMDSGSIKNKFEEIYLHIGFYSDRNKRG